MKTVVIVTQMALLIGSALQKETGAPLKGCATMMPEHKDPETNTDVNETDIKANYQITGAYDVAINQLKVTLKGVGAAKFQGFLIRVKDPSGSFVAGKFNITPPIAGVAAMAKGMTCDDEDDSATHVDVSEKDVVEFMWEPAGVMPPNEVVLYATVVKEKLVFAQILSSQISLTAGTAFIPTLGPSLPPAPPLVPEPGPAPGPAPGPTPGPAPGPTPGPAPGPAPGPPGSNAPASPGPDAATTPKLEEGQKGSTGKVAVRGVCFSYLMFYLWNIGLHI